MSLPLRWAVGDRCLLRGRVGVVRSISTYAATVRWPDGTYSGGRIDELDLVPESEASHSSRAGSPALGRDP